MVRSKGKQGSFSQQLLRDAASDLVGLGLTAAGVWLPASVAITLIERAASAVRSKPPTFVHWDMDEGRLYSRYAGHQQALVQLQYRSESWLLPSVLERRIGRSQSSLRATLLKGPEERFRLDPAIRSSTAEAFETLQTLLRERHLVDGRNNVRLTEVRQDARRRPRLVLQRTAYFDYARTNLVMDYRAKGAAETLRERVHPRGELEPLARSPLGNLLGINTLLFTADGDLIVPTRSQTSIFRPGEYTSSSSGTVESIDVRRGQLDLLRESSLELGIRERDLSRPLTVLAVTRELVRGGQPELFCFGHLGVGRREVRRRIRVSPEREEIEREGAGRGKVAGRKARFFNFGTLADGRLASASPSRALAARQIKFDELFAKLLDELGAQASVPLLTNLALWWDYRRGIGSARSRRP